MNPDARDMSSTLSEAGADTLRVGAYALAAHGVPRATLRRSALVATILTCGLLAVACGDDGARVSPTEMVFIRGVGTRAGSMRYRFGDEEGCPASSCEFGSSVSPAYPAIQVELQPFAVDVHEVTNAQYADCVDAGACEELVGWNLSSANIESYHRNERYADYPVVNVSERQAEQYCGFVDKRLPTELEWEFLSRAGGTNTKAWPFGDELEDCRGQDIAAMACDVSVKSPAPVGTSTGDAITIETVDGPVVIYDLTGNVSEWMGHPYVKQLTCAIDPAFEAACGMDCEAACGSDVTCQASCRRTGSSGGCDYCATGSEAGEDCFTVCDFAMCVRQPDSFVLQDFNPHDPDAELSPYVEPEYHPYRGGNFLSSETDPIGVRSPCLLRCSYRLPRKQRTTASDWLGFRCAKTL